MEITKKLFKRPIKFSRNNPVINVLGFLKLWLFLDSVKRMNVKLLWIKSEWKYLVKILLYKP